MTDVNEINKETLESIVQGLRHQEKLVRINTSEACKELKEWVTGKDKEDPFINPVDKKDNPWIEKGGKCCIS